MTLPRRHVNNQRIVRWSLRLLCFGPLSAVLKNIQVFSSTNFKFNLFLLKNVVYLINKINKLSLVTVFDFNFDIPKVFLIARVVLAMLFLF